MSPTNEEKTTGNGEINKGKTGLFQGRTAKSTHGKILQGFAYKPGNLDVQGGTSVLHSPIDYSLGYAFVLFLACAHKTKHQRFFASVLFLLALSVLGLCSLPSASHSQGVRQWHLFNGLYFPP